MGAEVGQGARATRGEAQLQRRQLASGKFAYYYRFTDADGRRKNVRVGATVEEAQKNVRAILSRVDAGRVGREVPTPESRARRTIAVRDLVARFLGDVPDAPAYAPPRIKSIKSYRRDARSIFTVRVLPALGDRAAADVTSSDVERLRDALLAPAPAGAGLANASVVQTLALLSKLFTWSRKAGLVDCANPVSGVERPRAESSIDFLDRAEVGALLVHVADQARAGVASWQGLALAPMVATAIYTGMRKGELFGLRWGDVQLDAGRIDVNRSYELLPKGGKPRHVPLHPELARILRAWRKVCPPTPERLVFPVEADPPGWRARKGLPMVLRMGSRFDGLALDAALAGAGCHAPADGKPWHMLRHTYASHFVMSGGSLYDLQRLLGHASPTTTQRYAHLAPDHLAAAVARMAFPAPSPAGVDDLAEARRLKALGAADEAGEIGHQ